MFPRHDAGRGRAAARAERSVEETARTRTEASSDDVAAAGSDADPRKLERDRQPLQLENWLTGLDWTAGDVGG